MSLSKGVFKVCNSGVFSKLNSQYIKANISFPVLFGDICFCGLDYVLCFGGQYGFFGVSILHMGSGFDLDKHHEVLFAHNEVYFAFLESIIACLERISFRLQEICGYFFSLLPFLICGG